MSRIPAGATLKLARLGELAKKVQHLHGLVEQFAATPGGQEPLIQPLKRAFRSLKLELMGAGLDSMSQIAGGLEIAAGRGGSNQTKIRILRDGVGSLRSQIEIEQRVVHQEIQTARAPAGDEPNAG